MDAQHQQPMYSIRSKIFENFRPFSVENEKEMNEEALQEFSWDKQNDSLLSKRTANQIFPNFCAISLDAWMEEQKWFVIKLMSWSNAVNWFVNYGKSMRETSSSKPIHIIGMHPESMGSTHRMHSNSEFIADYIINDNNMSWNSISKCDCLLISSQHQWEFIRTMHENEFIL